MACLGFLSSELPFCAPEKARFHIVPVPYESTVTYGGGTARGPAAIIEASDQLEAWIGDMVPGEGGVYTWPAVDVTGNAEAVLERVSKAVTQVLDLKGFPIVLGGEHTVTYGPLAALKRRFGRFGVVQIDAHADLRDSYDGTPWSHASIMARAVKDLDLPLVQLGVRALCLEEMETRKRCNITCHDAPALVRLSADALRDLQLLPEDFPEQIYITFDVDGLDPAVIAATGTPVPGGLDWYMALDLCRKAMKGRRVLGFDVVELAPAPGFHASDFAAARLVYELMGLVQQNTPDIGGD